MSNTVPSAWFGPVQRRLLTAAATFLALLFIATFLLLVFFVLQKAVIYFSGVIWPLSIAGILTVLLRPVTLAFQRRLKLGRTGSIILLYAVVLLTCLGLLAWLIPLVVIQIFEFADWIPLFIENLKVFILEKFPQLFTFLESKLNYEFIRPYLDKILATLSEIWAISIPALKGAGVWAGTVIAWTTGFAIIPIYLFYFLGSDHDPTKDLEDQLTFIKSDIRHDFIYLIHEFIDILVAFFRGQLLIGLIMGALLAVGFTAIGLKFGIVLGLLIGLLNIVPYFGTILGLATVLPIAFFQPDGGLVILVLGLGVFAAVQMVEGYLLTPKIMGKQTGLHPVAVIISLFFWGTVFQSLLGMILAIPLTAFFVVAWRLMKNKYLPRLIQGDKADSIAS